MKKHILFDLDGTLTDPMLGITKSVRYALNRYGIEVDDLRDLIPFIGPPLAESFERYYGFSHEEAMKAVDVYREYFAPTGIFENEVYPGIPEMLKALKDRGAHLYVATSKPQVFAQRITDHFDISQYLTFVCGSELDGSRVRKTEVIEYLMEHFSIRPEDAVMVGDRMHDIEGAAACGMESVGVLYGYGPREELEEAGAGCIVQSVGELQALLMK